MADEVRATDVLPTLAFLAFTSCAFGSWMHSVAAGLFVFFGAMFLLSLNRG